MGTCKMPAQNFADDPANQFTEKDLFKLETLNSLPFAVDFFIPVAKVVCGDGFSALLTAEAQVFTWGTNQFGQLGIDNEHVLVQLRPNSQWPVQLDADKNAVTNVLDIAAGAHHMMALTDQQRVFVWGRRMGIYPQIELTLDSVEKNGLMYSTTEVNQARPRLAKNNLVFYRIDRIFCCLDNAAVVTDQGELLVRGMNDTCQLQLRKEVTQHLDFFAEFVKLEFFNPK
jgi:alpha-tubulin suppressor-like RCC1 family protein